MDCRHTSSSSKKSDLSRDDIPKIDFSTVLASSVHDMKNSIGMLLSSIENITEDLVDLDPATAKYYSTLHYEASRINGELVQLLSLYRMENSFLALSIDDHYVIDLLEEQIARNSRLCETSNIQVYLQCNDLLKWVFDNDLLAGVIHNVLINSVRYTRTKIRIEASKADDFLRIAIEDDGQGYPEAMLREPSAFVKQAELSKGKTHLGLYFAEQIARLHTQKNRHGYIRLHNDGNLGGGCFELFLP